MAKKKLSNLALILKKLIVLVDAKYATKDEAGANFASVAEGKASIRELT